jgi:hypothetical protein
VAPLINSLEESGFPIKNCHISYYSVSEQAFVFIKEPLDDSKVIPSEDIVENQRLVIKCRLQHNISPSVMDHRKQAMPVHIKKLDEMPDMGHQPGFQDN